MRLELTSWMNLVPYFAHCAHFFGMPIFLPVYTLLHRNRRHFSHHRSRKFLFHIFRACLACTIKMGSTLWKELAVSLRSCTHWAHISCNSRWKCFIHNEKHPNSLLEVFYPKSSCYQNAMLYELSQKIYWYACSVLGIAIRRGKYLSHCFFRIPHYSC